MKNYWFLKLLTLITFTLYKPSKVLTFSLNTCFELFCRQFNCFLNNEFVVRIDSSEVMQIRENIQSVLLSNLSRSDGSALYSFGETVIQTSTFGPTEVHQSKEDPINATIEVIYRRIIKNTIRDNPEIKLIERFILSNISSIMYRRLHPRTLVTVVLQEMQNSGSLLASCLNGVCFALLDSGFPLKYLLAAVSAVITTDGQIIVNATNTETESAVAVFTIVFESIDKKVVSVTTDGTFNFSQLKKTIDMCEESALKIFNFYRNSFEKRFENHLKS